MKLSELIKAASDALATHGDIDVFAPCADEDIHGDIYPLGRHKVRQAGSPYVPRNKWSDDDARLVFVVD